MSIRPLGPDGVQQRIAEIRRRIEEKTGLAANPDGATDSSNPLRGPIGSTRSIGGNGFGDLRPFNPFSDGVSVESKSSPANLAPMIQRAAAQAGVDPALFDALVATESAYNPAARSHAGALGLSQLMPGTARELGVRNPMDPWENLQGGAAYLSQMLRRFDGDPRLALAAYNAGPGAVERHGGIPPYDETRRYVDKVLARFESRRNG